MKFQKKIFLVYALFGIVSAVATGSIYYSMSKSHFIQQECMSLSSTAKQINQQYVEMLRSMEDVSHYLLSDSDTLSAILMLAHLEKTPQNSNYIQEGKKKIQTMMSTDYLNQKFYRVIYYNKHGDVIASNNWGSREIKSGMDISQLDAYKNMGENRGELYIQGLHGDPWGKAKQMQVFSGIAKIQGQDIGFIEVQKTEADLEQIFQVSDKTVNVCLLQENGTILFQSGNEDKAFYQQFMQEKQITPGSYESVNGKKILAAGIYNKELGARIIVTEDVKILAEKMEGIYMITALMIAIILGFSFFYIIFTSKKLTEPIEQLRIFVRNAHLENLEKAENIPAAENEFKELSQIYKEMKEQLNQSIIREARLSTLQLQAQLDVLQAQVNPHFLYNVLNIISNRGVQDNDEVICDICDDLAGMLRYTTNTNERYADISSEKSYLQKYFSLLKYRYEHKLSYQIEIDDRISQQMLPKMILQQFVENSVSHGFENSTEVMRICVEGWDENDFWYVRIRDNGDGFRQDVLSALKEKMENVQKALSVNRQYIELKIGGMGLVNTYARLYLLYAEKTVFKLGNWKMGAEVLIGGPRDHTQKEGDPKQGRQRCIE